MWRAYSCGGTSSTLTNAPASTFKHLFYGLSAVFLLLIPLSVHAAPTVVINELMWDGVEYIELYNTSTEPIGLTNWTLTRQQAGSEPKTIVTIGETTLAPHGFWLLEKNEAATTTPADQLLSTLTLVNTGELVTLRDTAGNIVDSAGQLGDWFAGENTEAGAAMERTDALQSGTEAVNWHTATTSTAGRVGSPRTTNSVPPVNVAPTAVIAGPTSGETQQNLTFSAEDSSDDGATLTYAWSFGDGATGTGVEQTHTYSSAGSYTVRLTVSDGDLETEATKTVTVTAPTYATTIIINEFLPDPVGADTAAEFIELKNTSSTSVSLTGWQLDDAEGGSTPYTIPAGVTIEAGGYKVFYRSETKTTLNNSADTVRLLNPAGVVAASASYSEALTEGSSYNRQVSAYVGSTTTTPGKENSITQAAEEEDSDSDEDTADSAADTSAAPKTTTSKTGRVAGTQSQLIALGDIRDEEVGASITTEGVVSAPPGIVGKKLMYLAGSGIQVYFSAAFPALALGDKVRVTGELGSNQGEARLKVAQATDIVKVGSGAPPEPHQVQTGDINEDYEGSLVIIVGKVSETSGDTFYVDDGSGEVKVFITSASTIDKPKMKQGTAVTITGVVSQTKSGYRILPRFQEDIRLGGVAGLTSFPATGSLLFIAIPFLIVCLLLTRAYQQREPLLDF